MTQLIDPADYRPKYSSGKRVASGEYRSWQMMKNRCMNPNSKEFIAYSGRGIWPTWLSFDNFIRDMGPRPTALHTIERKNNCLGYGPDNCEWATRGVQSRNRAYCFVGRERVLDLLVSGARQVDVAAWIGCSQVRVSQIKRFPWKD